jgi:hypothetical protein
VTVGVPADRVSDADVGRQATLPPRDTVGVAAERVRLAGVGCALAVPMAVRGLRRIFGEGGTAQALPVRPEPN